MKRPKENKLYPSVRRWLESNGQCFVAAINKGVIHGRIDVVGVRDVGGDLSGEVETIGVEVKRGTEPFATASGQTLGYRVYANRVYLADFREESFNPEQVAIASHLGIGLIWINGTKQGKVVNGERVWDCREVLSSPYYRPMTRLNLRLMERLALGFCQICNSMFKIGDLEEDRFSNVTREDLNKALEKKQGLLFWNREVAKRKRDLGVTKTEEDSSREHRFICPDCMSYVLSQFREKSKLRCGETGRNHLDDCSVVTGNAIVAKIKLGKKVKTDHSGWVVGVGVQCSKCEATNLAIKYFPRRGGYFTEMHTVGGEGTGWS